MGTSGEHRHVYLVTPFGSETGHCVVYLWVQVCAVSFLSSLLESFLIDS